jgi:7-keto-8-aminopelargonate synthetase-like enzyme
VLTALNIVRSEEGRTLRRKLMDNILYLRAELTRAGLETLGDPSPIVPVRLGLEGVGRFASRHLMALGGIANLVEYPAVPQGGARFRFQVMASHTQEDIDQVVKILAKAMRDADLEYRLGHEGQQDATRPATASSSAAA